MVQSIFDVNIVFSNCPCFKFSLQKIPSKLLVKKKHSPFLKVSFISTSCITMWRFVLISENFCRFFVYVLCSIDKISQAWFHSSFLQIFPLGIKLHLSFASLQEVCMCQKYPLVSQRATNITYISKIADNEEKRNNNEDYILVKYFRIQGLRKTSRSYYYS